MEELGDRDDQRPVACEAHESRLERLGLERHDAVVDDDGAVAGAEPPGDRGFGLADAEDTGRERHQRPLDALVGAPRRRRRAAVVERISMRGVDERRPRPGGTGEPGGDPCLGAMGMDHVGPERAVGASDGPDRGDEGGRRGARDRCRQERHREVRPLSGRPADRDLVAALLKLGGEDADVAEGPARPRPEHLKDPGHQMTDSPGSCARGRSAPSRAWSGDELVPEGHGRGARARAGEVCPCVIRVRELGDWSSPTGRVERARGGGPAPRRGRRHRSSAAAAAGSSPGSER